MDNFQRNRSVVNPIAANLQRVISTKLAAFCCLKTDEVVESRRDILAGHQKCAHGSA
jgi:hypothetical protein